MFGRRKQTRAPTVRILFATDLHGSDIVFRKFLNAVGVYEARIAILGGDLTGKRLAPLVHTSEGYVTELLGRREVATTDDEADAVEHKIRDLGQYPVRMSEAEYAAMQADAGEVDRRFEQACKDQVADWMARAAERLEPVGIPMYVTGGNDDYMSIEEVLDAATYAVNAESRVIEIASGIEMLSTGYGNMTPWACPRDISEEELSERIELIASKLTNPRRGVFNLHVPPFGSGLDRCAKLDTSVNPPRPIVGEEMSAGSTAVRRAIEQHQPMLSLHGHIHEASGIQRVGDTLAINPGSEYGEGVLRSAVIDVDESEGIRSAQLLTA